jgi:hypothetical protein
MGEIAVATPPVRQARASGGRSVPAAVVEREIDATVPAREGVRVRQFSGDPEATDAPFVTPEQRQQLERMRADLDTFRPERAALVSRPDLAANDPFVNRPNIGGGAHYTPAVPGSPVGDDIRVISEQKVGNQAIAAAIDDLLAGKPPTNRLHTAAIDAAQGYIERRPGYRGPRLPMEWATPASRGGEPVAINDFEAFSRMFDDIEPAPFGTEAGESGFIAASLVPKLGGAAAGAAVGGATGDSSEDRTARALLGAGAGFAGGAAVARQLAKQGPRLVEGLAARPAASTGRRLIPIAGLRPINAQGGPIRDPLKGFEPFISKFSNPLVREGVRERLTAHAGFPQQRRGVINVQRQARLAERVAVDVSRSLPKGTPLNAEQVTAYARAVDKTMGEVQRLSAVVNSGKATDADLLALKAAEADHAVVLASLVGARAEAGRALQAFRAFSGALETGDVNLIRAATKGLRDDAQELARKVIAAGPDPLARYEVLKQSAAASLMDKARSYYYANILSGVKTHERNFLGNTFNALSNLAVHPVAAGVDAMRSAATGKARTVTLGEWPHQFVGTFAGIERGLRDFAFTLRHGISPDRLSRSVQQAEQHGQFDLPRVELAGGGANPLNYPGRLLDAADALFRSINRHVELYGQAYTKARTEGLKGKALHDRMSALVTGIASDAGELHHQAATFATRAVFQEQPGKFASRLQGIVRDYPLLAFVIPFVKTPANILRQGLEFSPAGVFMQAAKQEGRAGVQAHARIAAGTAAAGALAWLAATGRLSGSGPRDPAERAALMESGWRPNSIRIGDSWVSYSLFQPVSVQAAIVANAFEAWQQAGAKADVATAAASTVFRSMDSFLDQSFLSGLFDVVQAVSRGEVSPDSAMRTAGRTAHSLTPLAGLQRTVRDAVDPVQRKPETAGQAFRVNIPGASSSVRPRVDRFGEVVAREGGPVRRAVDPFNVSSVVTDRVASELDRLGVRLNLPQDVIRRRGERVELSSQQEVALQQIKGRAIRFALERLIDSAGYQRLADEQRAERLERAIRSANQRASRRAPRALGLDIRPIPQAAAR